MKKIVFVIILIYIFFPMFSDSTADSVVWYDWQSSDYSLLLRFVSIADYDPENKELLYLNILTQKALYNQFAHHAQMIIEKNSN
ncbi:MAG: hypothetical protein MJB14_14460, partial [Spirochaetes bacterium]|nr:hypothetical protein [Spirochaetota bacterium]